MLMRRVYNKININYMYKAVTATLLAICQCISAPICGQKLKNDVKINLSAVVLKNLSVQYGRGVTKHIAFAMGLRCDTKGTMRLQTQLQSRVKSSNIDFGALQIGNFAITLAVRFYMGRGRQRGLYVAPSARYAYFAVDLPIFYQTGTQNTNALFSGHTRSLSGGIMFGMQYTFAKTKILDSWLVGAHYSSCNGSATFTPTHPLVTQEQQNMQKS